MRWMFALFALLFALDCYGAEPKQKAPAAVQDQEGKQRLKDAIADKQKEIQDVVREIRSDKSRGVKVPNGTRKLERLKNELAALRKLKTLPPPIKAAPKFPQEFSVGSSGAIYDTSARVIQIIDDKTFRAEVHLAWGSPKMTVFVQGIPTEDLVDDAKTELPSVMEVVGTRKYITASGVSRKEFVIAQPKARKEPMKE